MKPDNLPKKIIRLEDGAEFLLNENLQRYFLWMPNCENHQSIYYTWENLMEDNKGYFKVSDGKEDLLAMKKAWFDSVNKPSDGHGDGDYD